MIYELTKTIKQIITPCLPGKYTINITGEINLSSTYN